MTIGMTHRLTSDPDMASTPGPLAMSWSEPYPGDAIPYRRTQLSRCGPVLEARLHQSGLVRSHDQLRPVPGG